MQTIGIFLSGGLDSAILAALLKKDYNVNAYCFNQANALTFAHKISEILHLPLTEIHIDINNDRNELQRALAVVDKFKKDEDTFYIAVTAIPDIKFSVPHDIPNRPTKKEIETNTGLKAPFADITKDIVLNIGLNEVKEINKLIKYSHSCYNTNGIRCGKCFNCEERAWAFSELNVIDTGYY